MSYWQCSPPPNDCPPPPVCNTPPTPPSPPQNPDPPCHSACGGDHGGDGLLGHLIGHGGLLGLGHVGVGIGASLDHGINLGVAANVDLDTHHGGGWHHGGLLDIVHDVLS